MKKLLIIVTAILMISCTQEFKDIEPNRPLNGTTVSIDSTKWQPALIQTEKDKLIVYDGTEVREVNVVDAVDTFGFGWLLGILFALIVVAILIRD